MSEYDKDVLKQFGLISGNSVQITLRGALQDDDTTSPIIIKLRGMYTEMDMSKFAAGEKGTLACTIACRYYSLKIDRELLVEIDIDNMTRIKGNRNLSNI